ncbi:hypothetical protein BDV12DRAFT_202306 [Aspergillus spectabilis]
MENHSAGPTETLQEKCRRLEFENRRLRRTLRCVECNSRISPPTPSRTQRPLRSRVLSSRTAVDGTSAPSIVESLKTPGKPGVQLADDLAWQSMINEEALGFTQQTTNPQVPLPHNISVPRDGWTPAAQDRDNSSHSLASMEMTIDGPWNYADVTQLLGCAADVENGIEWMSPAGHDHFQLCTERNSSISFDDAAADFDCTSGYALPRLPPKLPMLPGLKSELGFKTGHALQRMDTYIQALGAVIRQGIDGQHTPSVELEALVTRGVLWIVREAWPAAEGFWKLTASLNGFVRSELWRLFPCRQTYENLHPSYRPTMLQVTVPHPPLIDWLPWPELRDQIIRFQHQIDVEAVCKSAIESVVAHREPSTDREGEADLPTFRVWDLYLLEKQSGVGLTNNQLSYKPRSSSVLSIERAYNLVYDDFLTQKLDPVFFRKYPMLACEGIKTAFYVQDIPFVDFEDAGHPRPFSDRAVVQLKHLLAKRVHRRET